MATTRLLLPGGPCPRQHRGPEPYVDAAPAPARGTERASPGPTDAAETGRNPASLPAGAATGGRWPAPATGGSLPSDDPPPPEPIPRGLVHPLHAPHQGGGRGAPVGSHQV